MDLSLLIHLNLKGFFARKNLKIFKIFKRQQGSALSPIAVVFFENAKRKKRDADSSNVLTPLRDVGKEERPANRKNFQGIPGTNIGK